MVKQTALAGVLALALSLAFAGCRGGEQAEAPPNAVIETIALSVEGMT